MKNDSVLSLFDDSEELEKWKEEWKGMPEYVSEDKKPVHQIIVSFASYADMKEFAKLLNMNVSPKTNSTWFPHRPHTKYTKGYSSEK